MKQNVPIQILMIILSSWLISQGAPELSLSVTESKLNLRAEEKDRPAEIVYYPGDTLLYSIIAINSGDGVMNDPEVVDPIPPGLTYLPNSASGDFAHITFSIDNGAIYQEWPPTYTEVDKSGKEVVKMCTPNMVTHIKWQIQEPLKPGDNKNLTFKAVIN